MGAAHKIRAKPVMLVRCSQDLRQQLGAVRGLGAFAACGLRLATFRQGCGWWRTLGWSNKQLGDSNAEGPGKAIEKIDCRVRLLPLKSAHIGAINTCIVGQLLLRDTALDADPAHIISHKRTSSHARRQPFRWSSNHWL